MSGHRHLGHFANRSVRSSHVAHAQHVPILEPHRAHSRAQRLIQCFDRCQVQAGLARAQDDRRQHQVQLANNASIQEARQRFSSAFDQNAGQSAGGQSIDDSIRLDPAVVVARHLDQGLLVPQIV